jgi:hypothetical protein
MCPFCISTAALIALGVTSTGGALTIAIRRLGGKNGVGKKPASTLSKLSGKDDAAREIVPNSH